MENNKIDKLLQFFNIAKTQIGNIETIVPGVKTTKKNTKGNKEVTSYRPINFPTDVQQAYQYFLQNQSIYNPNRNRFELYRSLLFMVRNSGLMLSALQTYITETIEMKDGEKPIQIKGKERKIEKFFYNWLDSIGFNYNVLNELVYDLALLGDAFFLNTIDLKEGVTGIQLIDPFMIKDRMELNLSRIEEIKTWSKTNQNYTNSNKSIQDILAIIKNQGSDKQIDASLYYKSYLLGFELKYAVDNDNKSHALPPWYITHFRLFTTKSEFFPFGRPLFINSLAPFQSYKTTEMLIDMLRVAAFPKELITIKGGDTLNTMDRVQRVEEVREFIENVSPVTNNKDNLSINERMYCIEDLFDFKVLDSNIDMDKLGDLTNKKEDLILSTAIPDSYLIPSRGSGLGGENASALYYNNKIFQRRVESIKSAILEGFSNSFRLHLSITEQFDAEETEFELYMPVNSEMYNSDKVRQDTDMLTLATELMNNLGQALGLDRGQSLPLDVVKDIFQTYLPINDDILNKWINKIVKKDEEDEEEGKAEVYNGNPAPLIVPVNPEGNTTSPNSSLSKRPKKEKYQNTISKFLEDYNHGEDSLIREAYFKTKKEYGYTNGWLGNYVYWNDTYHKEKYSGKLNIYNLMKEHICREKAKKLED
jgi:hypothetical protein